MAARRHHRRIQSASSTLPIMVVILVYLNVFKLSASILSTIDWWRVVFGTWKQMGRWNPDTRSGGRDAFFRAVIGSCVIPVAPACCHQLLHMPPLCRISCNLNILPYRRGHKREPSSKSCAPGSLGSTVGTKVMAKVVCPLLPQSSLLSPDYYFSGPAQAGVHITVRCALPTINHCILSLTRRCAARLTSPSLLLQTHVARPATWHIMRGSHLSSPLRTQTRTLTLLALVRLEWAV